MTPLDRCDEAAAQLMRAYVAQRAVAFVLRTQPNGDVSLIGPQLSPDTVARMLHAAADAYKAQAKTPTPH